MIKKKINNEKFLKLKINLFKKVINFNPKMDLVQYPRVESTKRYKEQNHECLLIYKYNPLDSDYESQIIASLPPLLTLQIIYLL